PEREGKKDEKKELSPGQTTINSAIEAKAEKIGYGVRIRVCYVGDSADVAKQRLQALFGGFKQFNTINLNGLTNTGYDTSAEALQDYRARYMGSDFAVLNVEELASLYHLPHTSVETPNIAWTTTKVGEPPTNLPTLANTPAELLSLIGTTTFRQTNVKFGVKREDRKRHLYIIGKSGSGKSFLLLLLTLSDIYQNQGFAIVDPHGDFAQDATKYIPESRMDDVIYFNPSDFDSPISFNPMENADPNMRASIASEIIGVLKKMFAESWGPRLEHILRFTLLALIETEDSNLMGITRMLTDKAFRKKIVDQVTDSTVKAFWVNEFASWNEKFQTEAVAPILNKVGAFTANPLIRNVIGQSKSSFDIRQIMDEGKILICDLSRGRLGEDNAATLGALLITKIQLAAMSRANIPLNERRPFYLYVDEFQNFATDSFAVILSEARKYGLYLTVANQYVAQMPQEVRDAVFGNVGSMITFRVGADDAAALARYFEPVFEPNDLGNLSLQNIYVTMSIDGETSIPFSAKTLRLPESQQDNTIEIMKRSRAKYNVDRAVVEEAIAQWSGLSQNKTESGNAEQGGGRHSLENMAPLGGVQAPHTPVVGTHPVRPSLEVAGAQPKTYSTLIKSAHTQSHQPASQRNQTNGGSSSRNRNRNNRNRKRHNPQ
ncbi:type IV secretory system conjugative DNA transfer family protein, partial [Candidatus Saccharibacteria bacterium]|nr:type IV secretory system conjugative DNA transfer family protein [Candidatus Saccharibacteria bacterium]